MVSLLSSTAPTVKILVPALTFLVFARVVVSVNEQQTQTSTHTHTYIYMLCTHTGNLTLSLCERERERINAEQQKLLSTASKKC